MLTPNDLVMVAVMFAVSFVLGLVAVQLMEALLLAFLSASFVIITVCDLRYRIIPDLISFPLFLAGNFFSALQGVEIFLTHVASSISVVCLLLILRNLYFMARQRVALGLGDVKLISAAAAWLGPLRLADYLLVAALLALVQYAISRRCSNDRSVPFGPALALSLLCFVFATTMARH